MGRGDVILTKPIVRLPDLLEPSSHIAILCTQRDICIFCSYKRNVTKNWQRKHLQNLWILWRYGPDSKEVVCETSKQSLTIRRPSNGHTLWLPSLLTYFSISRFELINNRPNDIINKSGQKKVRSGNWLALQIENFYTACSSCAQPVPVRREHKGINNITGLKRVEVFALIQVPKHGNTILASWCSKRTIRGNGNGVDVSGVAIVVGLQFELWEFPDLVIGVNIWSKLKNGWNKSEILVETYLIGS